MRNSLGPLFLILVCPPFAILLWYTNTALQGSLFSLFQLVYQQGFFHTLYQIWHPIFWGSGMAWRMLFYFVFFQLLLMRFLPGKTFQGPVTPKGHVPTYKANGVAAFFMTMIGFCLASFYFHFFSASLIYDNFGYLLGALNISSLLICLLLYFKGRFFPSTHDAGITGNPIFDYYWGTELYPRILGWDIKMLIICRIGMMSWGIILISYAAKQAEIFGLSNSLFISVALQLIYLAKFFVWEDGYLCSLDIMHDRAGFYTLWGCLVWVPCIYTSASMYLVMHPIHLNEFVAGGILLLGCFFIFINYAADRQRQRVRQTLGQCRIWGKTPRTILATYTTEKGETKQNLLLASGWWQLSRHFHYVPEILAAFCWSVPALFTDFLPYFYVCFLTVLLIDRAFRDDKRCEQKYKEYWRTYCELVPYKIIPFLI